MLNEDSVKKIKLIDQGNNINKKIYNFKELIIRCQY